MVDEQADAQRGGCDQPKKHQIGTERFHLEAGKSFTADCADMADKEKRTDGHEKAREDTKKDAGAGKSFTADCADLADTERRTVGHEKARKDTKKEEGRTADCADMADKGRHGFLESVLSAQSAVPSLCIFALLCG